MFENVMLVRVGTANIMTRFDINAKAEDVEIKTSKKGKEYAVLKGRMRFHTAEDAKEITGGMTPEIEIAIVAFGYCAKFLKEHLGEVKNYLIAQGNFSKDTFKDVTTNKVMLNNIFSVRKYEVQK